jgi:hypothetical protein
VLHSVFLGPWLWSTYWPDHKPITISRWRIMEPLGSQMILGLSRPNGNMLALVFPFATIPINIVVAELYQSWKPLALCGESLLVFNIL